MLKDNGIEKLVDMNRDGYFISTIVGILGKGDLDGKDGANGIDGIEEILISCKMNLSKDHIWKNRR